MSGRPEVGALLEALAGRAAVGAALIDADGRYLFVNPVLAAMTGRPAAEHVGLEVGEVLPPELSRTVRAQHRRVLSTGAAVDGVRIAGTLAGREGTWLASYHPLEHGGRRVVGVVVIDISEQARAEQRLARRAEQQSAVVELGRRALAHAPLGDLFAAATAELARALDAELAAVLELGRDGTLALRAGVGWEHGDERLRPAAGSQFARTLAEQALVVTAGVDAHADDRLLAEQGVRSGMAMVIRGRDEPWGILAAHSRQPRAFSDDDAAFVRAVANVLAGAIQLERFADDLRRTAEDRGRLVAEALDAADAERVRMAELLHDDVLQTLLYARQELVPAASAEPALAAVADAIDAAIRSLRRTVADVHPVVLEHGGLPAALRALAAEHERQGELRVDLRLSPRAQGSHDRLVVALVRELLRNVVKHAHASTALVALDAADGELTLAVSDDGHGFDPDELAGAVSRGHVGLASCFQRTRAAGGTARIEPVAPHGTRIVLTLPLP